MYAVETDVDPERENELARRVKIFLGTQAIPSLRYVEVKVERDCVILSGHVRSFHERQVALSCCQR
ncbi:MAG TPA: BON domain-containing protein, partial [Pirellulales bacterium]